MKTLLFNKNPIISKLVRMSAQKMEYEFEERLNYASDIDSYDVIIVDDGISADLKVLQGKCKKLIYISSGASANEESRQVLHKPFLPTDLIALMRIDEAAAAQADKDKGANAEKDALKSENVSENADENASADEEDIDLDSLSFDNKLLEPESASEPALAETQNESANAANDEAVLESTSDDNAQDNNIYLQDITGENAENADDEKESVATTAQNSASDEPSTDENAQNTEPEKPKDELEITPVDFKAGDFDFNSIAPSGETALNSDIADEILANIQSQEPANTSEPADESALNASQNDESVASEDAPLEFDAQDLADITQGLGVDEQGAENSALNEDSQSESVANPQNDENNATDFPQQGTLSDDELAKASFLQPLNEPFQSEPASTSDEPADENLTLNSNEQTDENLALNSNEQTSENLTLNSSETKGENLADEDLSQILNDEQATDIQAKSTSSEQDLSDESLPQENAEFASENLSDENAENAPETLESTQNAENAQAEQDTAQETPSDELATQENAEFSSENLSDDENTEILGENLDENVQMQSPALDETSAEIQAQIKDISALENEANAPLDEPQSAKSVMSLDEGAQSAENALEMVQETLESTQNAENPQAEQDTAQETPSDELATQENAEFSSENSLETTQKAEFASENAPDIMQNAELINENASETAQNAEFASQTAEQENEPLPQEPAFSVEEKQEKTMSFDDLPENAKFLGQKNNDFIDPDDIKPVLLDEMPMQQSTQDIVKGQLADLNAMDEALNSPNAQNSPSSEDDALTNSQNVDNENLLENLNTEQNATLAPSEQNESILASENLAQTQVSLDESLAQTPSEIKFDESFAPSDELTRQENAEFASENSLQTAQSDENLAQMQSDENFAQANDENLAQAPQINAPSSENALNADLTDDLQGLSEEELQRALGEIPAQESQAQTKASQTSQNTSAQNGENSSPSELMDELSRGISGAITSSIKDDALKAALKGMNMHIDINIKFDEDKA